MAYGFQPTPTTADAQKKKQEQDERMNRLAVQTNGDAGLQNDDTQGSLNQNIENNISNGFQSRTADYYNKVNNEAKQQFANGQTARGLGTATGGALGTVGRGLGEVVESGLNHTVFPVAEKIGQGWDGVKEFGKGLFGIEDKPATAANAGDNAAKAAADTAAGTGAGVNASNPYQTARQQAAQNAKDTEAQRYAEAASAVARASAADQSAQQTAKPQQPTRPATQTMPGFQPLQKPETASRPFVASFGDDKPELTKEQRDLLSQATTPIKGARGLTANQVRNAESILAQAQNSHDAMARAQMQTDADAARTAANNEAALNREYMQQTAAQNRDALNNAARYGFEAARMRQDNDQFNARLADAQAARQPELEAQRLKNQAAAQMQSLNDAYLNADTDGERGSLAKQINALNGRFGDGARGFDKDRFMKVQRESTDKNGATSQQDDIIDLATGKSILNSTAGGYQPIGRTQDGKIIYQDANGNKFSQ